MADENKKRVRDVKSPISGKIKFLSDYMTEAEEEKSTRMHQQTEAEGIRGAEAASKAAWSMGLSLAANIFLPGISPGLKLFLSTPTGAAVTTGIASTVGKLIGSFYSERKTGKRAEDYFVSEDVGKFDRGEASEIRDLNRQYELIDEQDFMKDLLDIGKSASLAYVQAGGLKRTPGKPVVEQEIDDVTQIMDQDVTPPYQSPVYVEDYALTEQGITDLNENTKSALELLLEYDKTQQGWPYQEQNMPQGPMQGPPEATTGRLNIPWLFNPYYIKHRD